jgi:hypothetical protein
MQALGKRTQIEDLQSHQRTFKSKHHSKKMKIEEHRKPQTNVQAQALDVKKNTDRKHRTTCPFFWVIEDAKKN